MMTLEEKIEVIKAYAEGKAVEVYDKYSNEWFAKERNAWDFDVYKYRIKPDETTKFAVGDVLVLITAKGELCPTRYKVIGVKENFYDFYNTSPYSIKEADEDFINTRMTIPEMDAEFGAYHDTLSWKPMYNLGFKLKDN